MNLNRAILSSIYSKTNGRCWYCGVEIPPFSDWQVEHQQPRSRGGTNDIENLVPSCRACNVRKGRRTVEEYRRSLMVGLEHRITEALEFAEEIESYTGWPEGDNPRSWLNSVVSCLQQAAEYGVMSKLKFYAESVDVNGYVPSEEEMAVINAEVFRDEADLPH